MFLSSHSGSCACIWLTAGPVMLQEGLGKSTGQRRAAYCGQHVPQSLPDQIGLGVLELLGAITLTGNWADAAFLLRNPVVISRFTGEPTILLGSKHVLFPLSASLFKDKLRKIHFTFYCN